MSLFLKTVSVEEALTAIRKLTPEMPAEKVPLDECLGRVLFGPVCADIDIPGFTRSVVDGYAVISADTTGASDAIPAILSLEGSVAMGRTSGLLLKPGQCAYVPTGAELPGGPDAVAMIEYCERIGNEILVKKAVAPGENILYRGEDFASGKSAIPEYTVLSEREIGVLAAIGSGEVMVFKRPVIGIISTGNELVPVTDTPAGAQVRDVNSHMCGSFVRSRGSIPRMYGITPDNRDSLRSVLKKAADECDAVLISGGSSKDDRDLSADLIQELGEVYVHGIAISPGKPTIIGRAGKTPVIGLPGHPASAFIILMVIVQPLLTGMVCAARWQVHTCKKILAQNIPSSRGREDYVRVAFRDGMALPLFGKSGLLNTLILSDGIVKIPAGSEGIEAGDEVEVILW